MNNLKSCNFICFVNYTCRNYTVAVSVLIVPALLVCSMGSINSKGRQMIPANGARLTMIFEQRVPGQELEVIKRMMTN